MPHSFNWTLWLRWVVANALGEMIGLGATFAVAVWVIGGLGSAQTVVTILLSFLVAVLSGVIEASVVGLGQWWAMHPWFPSIPRRSWWLATLIGALIAYILGYLPSTLMSLGEEAAGAPPMAEPAQWIVLLLAAGMGAVGGVVLSFAQWRVLRRTVTGAGIWIPANMLAWALGMPVIFWGIDAAQKGQPVLQSVLLMAFTLLIAGAVVGAVHGIFLARLSAESRDL